MGVETGKEPLASVSALGRSVLRFSWAATVFGAQQTASLVGAAVSAGGRASTAEAFDAVAAAIEGQFGGVFRGAYRTGADCIPGAGPRRRGSADSARS